MARKKKQATNSLKHSFLEDDTNPLEKAQKVALSGGKILDKQDPKDQLPVSKFYDPLFVLDYLQFKTKNASWALSYQLLRKMSYRNGVIASIINTRINQASLFATPYVMPNDRIGYVVMPKNKKYHYLLKQADPNYKVPNISKEEVQTIIDIGEFISNCGTRETKLKDPQRDEFATFLRKIIRDTLTFDQLCFEIVKDPKTGKPSAFYAVDSGTIRLSDPKTRIEKGIYYVQFIDGNLYTAYAHDEMAFAVRNPSTDIKANGYGISEIEMALNYIASQIYGEEYNKRFFCLDSNTYIKMKQGIFKIKDLFDKNISSSIWVGDKFADCKIYKTGQKHLHKTILSDGNEIISSNEHLFQCLDNESYELVWKKQKDLTKNDVLLKTVSEIDNISNWDEFEKTQYYHHISEQSYIQQEYDKRNEIHVKEHFISDNDNRTNNFVIKSKLSKTFCEFLGQVFGDGTVVRRKDINRVSCLYREDQDLDLLKKHQNEIERMGLKTTIRKLEEPKSDKESRLLQLSIYSKSFVEFLLNNLGWNQNKSSLPAFVFKESYQNISAFVRGFFGANGENDVYGGRPCLVQKNKQLLLEIKHLLSFFGIDCRIVNTSNNNLKSHRLVVCNIVRFKEKIGFSTAYKNDKITLQFDSLKLHKEVKEWLIRYLKAIHDFEISQDYRTALKGCTYLRMLQLASKYRDKFLLNLFNNYRFVKVVEKIDLKKEEEMYDVEILDDERHQFAANGVIVHNTQGSTPKGILNIRGSNIQSSDLDAFRRAWHAQLTGVANAWKTPVLSSEQGIEWISLGSSNREMEFGRWLEYLVNVICGVYQIDPVEINFPNKGGVSGAGRTINDSSAIERLKFSKDKGLVPLLRFIEKTINKYIVSPLTDDQYEFAFYGYTDLIEEQKIRLERQEVEYLKTVNEIRATYGLKDIKYGDMILNPVYAQAKASGDAALAEQQQQVGNEEPQNEDQTEDENEDDEEMSDGEDEDRELDDFGGDYALSKNKVIP